VPSQELEQAYAEHKKAVAGVLAKALELAVKIAADDDDDPDVLSPIFTEQLEANKKELEAKGKGDREWHVKEIAEYKTKMGELDNHINALMETINKQEDLLTTALKDLQVAREEWIVCYGTLEELQNIVLFWPRKRKRVATPPGPLGRELQIQNDKTGQVEKDKENTNTTNTGKVQIIQPKVDHAFRHSRNPSGANPLVLRNVIRNKSGTANKRSEEESDLFDEPDESSDNEKTSTGFRISGHPYIGKKVIGCFVLIGYFRSSRF